MLDLQSEKGVSRFAIARCGVRDLRYPIVVRDVVTDETQSVVANWQVGVGIPMEKRGTHMSRFIEVIDQARLAPLSLDDHFVLADTLGQKLTATDVHVETAFTWFRRVTAPATGRQSELETDLTFISHRGAGDGEKAMRLSLVAKALCPCSKAISERGAHNQRSRITATIFMNPEAQTPAIETIASCMEAGASSPVYPLMKREDEKYVTERAFDNPTFVEDIVRRVADRLFDVAVVQKFTVEALNYESIHAHDCFAKIEYSR